MKLKGKILKSSLFRLRAPKCELCDATRDSLRPYDAQAQARSRQGEAAVHAREARGVAARLGRTWWSYVARMLLLHEISVCPPKYLIMKPPHTTDARPMAAHSGTIWSGIMEERGQTRRQRKRPRRTTSSPRSGIRGLRLHRTGWMAGLRTAWLYQSFMTGTPLGISRQFLTASSQPARIARSPTQHAHTTACANGRRRLSPMTAAMSAPNDWT